MFFSGENWDVFRPLEGLLKARESSMRPLEATRRVEEGGSKEQKAATLPPTGMAP